MESWIYVPWRIHKDLWAQGIPGQYKPIVDDVLDMRQSILADDPMSYHIKMANKFGHYFHTSFGPMAHLVINDPL